MKRYVPLLLLLPLLIVACGASIVTDTTPQPAISDTGEYADVSGNFSFILDYDIAGNTTISNVAYVTTYCKMVGGQNQRFVNEQIYQSDLSIDRSGTVTLQVQDNSGSGSVFTGTFNSRGFTLYGPQKYVLTPTNNEIAYIAAICQQETC